jgi:hypothetical protein
MTDPQLPMFYRNVVALSRERHKGWYVDADQGYSFAADSNSVFIAASEFAVAAREYAIVFARAGDGKAVPAVILGLKRDQNLLIDEGGAWRAKYVPAYVRRYPFILARASEESDEFTVCIDEAYSGFNTAKEGQQLITDDGEHGELLSNSVKFLQGFHQHTLITSQFCEMIDAAGLLDSMQANISLNSGENFSLSGFFAVTREKLKALSAEKLKELLDKDYLDLIYLHMHSLSNLDHLMGMAGAASSDAAVGETKQ